MASRSRVRCSPIFAAIGRDRERDGDGDRIRGCISGEETRGKGPGKMENELRNLGFPEVGLCLIDLFH